MAETVVTRVSGTSFAAAYLVDPELYTSTVPLAPAPSQSIQSSPLHPDKIINELTGVGF